MYILSFNLKERVLLLLQNVYEVKQSMPALRSVLTMCDLTRQNGLVTEKIHNPLIFYGLSRVTTVIGLSGPRHSGPS